MTPIDPLTRERAIPNGWRHFVYAKDQPQYLPLPVVKSTDGDVVSCWQLSARERLALLFGGRVWLTLKTFNDPLQPTRMRVGRRLSVVPLHRTEQD